MHKPNSINDRPIDTRRFLRVAGRPTQLLRPWALAGALGSAALELARVADALAAAVDDGAWNDLAAELRRAAIGLRALGAPAR